MSLKKKRLGRSWANPPEINVTPFIDVVLVILIIFMISSPAVISGFEVNLPKSATNKDIILNTVNITITIQKNGTIFINDSEIQMSQLIIKANSISKNDKNASIFIRGDSILQYGQVTDIINILTKSGYSKIVLVTDARK